MSMRGNDLRGKARCALGCLRLHVGRRTVDRMYAKCMIQAPGKTHFATHTPHVQTPPPSPFPSLVPAPHLLLQNQLLHLPVLERVVYLSAWAPIDSPARTWPLLPPLSFFPAPPLHSAPRPLPRVVLKRNSPGRYRLIIRGIFFAASSLSAISSGSVSPSTGTRTGAFMLCASASRFSALSALDDSPR